AAAPLRRVPRAAAVPVDRRAPRAGFFSSGILPLLRTIGRRPRGTPLPFSTPECAHPPARGKHDRESAIPPRLRPFESVSCAPMAAMIPWEDATARIDAALRPAGVERVPL